MAKVELLGVGRAEAFGEADLETLRRRGVSAVSAADLAAFVTSRPLNLLPVRNSAKLGRNILRVQRKLEAILAVEGFLPAAFNTEFEDKAAVEAFLKLNKSMLRSAIDAHAAYHQYQISVTWRPERMLAALQDSPEVAALQADDAPKSKHAAATALKEAASAICAAMSASVGERIAAAAAQCRQIPVGDPPMIANLVCLVKPEKLSELEAALEAIDADHDDQLLIRLAGPLPPCSFAAIFKRDVTPEAVRDAQERIGVDDLSSIMAIKRAYKTFMKTAHPDAGGEAALAAEGAQAYRLLKQLVEADLTHRLERRETISLCRIGAAEAA